MEIRYEIVEQIAPLEKPSKGWQLVLNRVSWNGNEPKYDIRPWNEDRTKCGKGITLTDEQLKYLGEIIRFRLTGKEGLEGGEQ